MNDQTKHDGQQRLPNPVAWVRFCSDGGIEGPILDNDSRMDGVRRTSGAWTPLYTAKPEPVNQQLLAALKDCMDDSRLRLAELEANCYGERGRKLVEEQQKIVANADAAIAAAEAAQPVGEWKHCSPELLASGIDCGTTPRRACQCPQGGSHDHFVAQQPAIAKPVAVPPNAVRALESIAAGTVPNGLPIREFAMHALADCNYPPSVAVPDDLLSADDMKNLRRFAECCEDFESGGHDVPKAAMKRLELAGAVRSCGFGRHEATAFGYAMLSSAQKGGAA